MPDVSEKAITLIVKLTDQCNLHCSYCYYYAGEFASLRTRKHANLSKKLERLSEEIEKSERCIDAESLYVVLHGGEPLLAPREDVRKVLQRLFEVRPDVNVTIQTNGILVDAEWRELFVSYGVSLGVSIDGPQDIHDKNRVFANGRGSYHEAVRGLRILQEAGNDGRVVQPGVLAVFDPEISAKVYFDHFVKELGVRSYDLLFPDDLERFENREYVINCFRRAVDETWRLWVDHDDPGLYIRFIHGALASVVRDRPYMDNFDRELTLVLDLAGDAFYEDNLRPLMPHHELRIGSWSLEGIDAMIDRVDQLLPNIIVPHADCSQCSLLRQCGGGSLSSRFNVASRQFSKSFLCDVYKVGLAHAKEVVNQAQAKRFHGVRSVETSGGQLGAGLT